MRSLHDRWRYSATATRISNWRNQRSIERGRRDLPRRISDQVQSRAPVLRSRISPATGRPHRMDAEFGRLSDQSLARMKDVRQSLATREPQYARTLERTVRDLSQRAGRSR